MQPARSKADRLKWNLDIIYFLSEEYGYEVKRHTETHLSLIHPKRERLDIWPTTSKGSWFKNNKGQGEAFKIEDMEAFIIPALKEIHELIERAEDESIFVNEIAIRQILANAYPKTRKR